MMRLPFLFAAMVLAASSAVALRADLIESAPFSLIGSSTGPVQQTVSVPQFDPALGILNAVTLSVTPAFQFVLETFDTGAGAVSVSARDTLSFNGTPLEVENNFTSTIPAGQPIYTFMPAPVGNGPLKESFGATAVSFFSGTGTVPFNLSLAPPTVVQFSGATTTGVLAFAGVSGTVVADYAFTPAVAPTPEPACFGVVGLGLIAIAKVTRRRSSGK